MGEGLKKFGYCEPKTVEEAISLLNKYKGKARLIAGGTDLLVLMKQRLVRPEYLINMKGISELDYVNFDDGEGLKVGALTTLNTIETSAMVQKRFGILAQAAGKVAALQIRNIGSIGGNICQDYRCWYHNQSHDWRRFWTPCYRRGGDICYVNKGSKQCQRAYLSDTAPALIALGAKLRVVGGKGERVIPAKDFFKKSRNILKADEILTEIQIPNQMPHTTGLYLKFSLRKAIDYPMVGIAVVMSMDSKNSLCHDIKIVSGAVTPIPLEIGEAEDILRGKKIDSDIIDRAAQTAKAKVAAQAIRSIDHSADFKTNIAGVLLKRAIEGCLRLANPC